jgi:nicotinamide-nucleotide amidase
VGSTGGMRGASPVSERAEHRAGDGPCWSAEAGHLAERAVGLLIQRQVSVGVAESLTGGLLGATLTTVPGASAVFRGGVIAYAIDVKAGLLGVPAELLATNGAVHSDVAAAMADGVRDRLGADLGVATTGVAGPDPSEGKPPGTVHIAVTSRRRRVTRKLMLAGSREQIRTGTVEQCLRLLLAMLTEEAR